MGTSSLPPSAFSLPAVRSNHTKCKRFGFLQSYGCPPTRHHKLGMRCFFVFQRDWRTPTTGNARRQKCTHGTSSVRFTSSTSKHSFQLKNESCHRIFAFIPRGLLTLWLGVPPTVASKPSLLSTLMKCVAPLSMFCHFSVFPLAFLPRTVAGTPTLPSLPQPSTILGCISHSTFAETFKREEGPLASRKTNHVCCSTNSRSFPLADRLNFSHTFHESSSESTRKDSVPSFRRSHEMAKHTGAHHNFVTLATHCRGNRKHRDYSKQFRKITSVRVVALTTFTAQLFLLVQFLLLENRISSSNFTLSTTSNSTTIFTFVQSPWWIFLICSWS